MFGLPFAGGSLVCRLVESGNAGEEVQHEVWSQLSSIDTFVMGRVTYDAWFDFWPRQRHSESQFDAKFSRFADDVEKIVLSNTMTAGAWKNSRIIGGDVRAKIAGLMQQPGKDLAIVGGVKIARELGRLQLIDEYRVWVQPDNRVAALT